MGGWSIILVLISVLKPMQKITPNLWFKGNAEEAVNFSCLCLQEESGVVFCFVGGLFEVLKYETIQVIRNFH